MVRRLRDLEPDGVLITVSWEHMEVGSSIFVPCINVDVCRRQAIEIADMFGWIVITQVRVEHYILGLRIWRTT
jgi:hypothetical protein